MYVILEIFIIESIILIINIYNRNINIKYLYNMVNNNDKILIYVLYFYIDCIL